MRGGDLGVIFVDVFMKHFEDMAINLIFSWVKDRGVHYLSQGVEDEILVYQVFGDLVQLLFVEVVEIIGNVENV